MHAHTRHTGTEHTNPEKQTNLLLSKAFHNHPPRTSHRPSLRCPQTSTQAQRIRDCTGQRNRTVLSHLPEALPSIKADVKHLQRRNTRSSSSSGSSGRNGGSSSSRRWGPLPGTRRGRHAGAQIPAAATSSLERGREAGERKAKAGLRARQRRAGSRGMTVGGGRERVAGLWGSPWHQPGSRAPPRDPAQAEGRAQRAGARRPSLTRKLPLKRKRLFLRLRFAAWWERRVTRAVGVEAPEARARARVGRLGGAAAAEEARGVQTPGPGISGAPGVDRGGAESLLPWHPRLLLCLQPTGCTFSSPPCPLPPFFPSLPSFFCISHIPFFIGFLSNGIWGVGASSPTPLSVAATHRHYFNQFLTFQTLSVLWLLLHS